MKIRSNETKREKLVSKRNHTFVGTERETDRRVNQEKRTGIKGYEIKRDRQIDS